MNSAAISSTTDASSANITVGPYSLTTLVLKPSSSSGNPGGAAATPELGSGELLALGFVPVLLLALRRKRRKA